MHFRPLLALLALVFALQSASADIYFTDMNLFKFNDPSADTAIGVISDFNIMYDFNIVSTVPNDINFSTLAVHYFSAYNDANLFGYLRNIPQYGYKDENRAVFFYRVAKNDANTNYAYRSRQEDDHAFKPWSYNEDPDRFDTPDASFELRSGTRWVKMLLSGNPVDRNIFFNISFDANYVSTGGASANLTVYDCNNNSSAPATDRGCGSFIYTSNTQRDEDGYFSIRYITTDQNTIVADKNAKLAANGDHWIFFNCASCIANKKWVIGAVNTNTNIDKNRHFSSTTGLAGFTASTISYGVHTHFHDLKRSNYFYWYASVRDNSGNDYNSAVYTMLLNSVNAKPLISAFNSPVGDRNYTGNIDANVSVTDDYPELDGLVCDLNLLNSGLVSVASIASDLNIANYSCKKLFDSNLYSDGNYYIWARVRETLSAEKYSNSATMPKPFLIDNHAPTITGATTITGFSTYGAGPYYLNGTGSIIGGTVADGNGSGVNTLACEYTLDGTAWLPATWNSSFGRCEKTGVTAANAVAYSFNIRVRDNVGLQATGTPTSTYTGDTAGPSVGATSLSGFRTYTTFISGSGTIIGGTVTDANSDVNTSTCEYTTNGTNWLSASWNTNRCEKTGITVLDGASYSFNTRAKDNLSNQGTGTATSSYTGDSSAPTTADNSDTSWHGNDQTITLSPSDGSGSDVNFTYYCVDSTNTCTPTSATGSGTSVSVSCGADTVCIKYVRYYSGDNIDNNEAVKSSNAVKIDKQRPSVGATTISGFLTHGSFIKGTGNVIGGTIADGNGSGINQSTGRYTKDNGSAWAAGTFVTNHVEKSGITVADGITYQFNTDINDNVNNNGAGTATIAYTGDLNAPATTVSGNSSAWTPSSQTITLSCSDASGAGCETISYRIDLGAWNTYSAPFTVDTDGNHRIDYNSSDFLGNSESMNTAYAAVDKTSPSVGATTINGFRTYGTNPYWIYGTGAILGGIASDSNSDLNTLSCEYSTDGNTWLSADWNSASGRCEKSSVTIYDGNLYIFSTRIRDNAGNQGKGADTNTYIGDTLPPLTIDNSDNLYHGGDLNILLSYTPLGGGIYGPVGVNRTYYCIDDTNSCTPATLYSSYITVSCFPATDCNKYVRYYSVDNLDINEAVKSSNKIMIAASAPSVGSTTISGVSVSGSFITAGAVTIIGGAATHADLNTLSCQYTSDGGLSWLSATWVTNHCEATIGVSNNNSYTFNTRIYTNTGIPGTGTATSAYTVDMNPPSTLVSGNSANWGNANQTITLICADGNGVGCNSTQYRIDSGAWTNYTAPFTISTDGNHRVDYNSSDDLNNSETMKTVFVALDKTSPTFGSVVNSGTSWKTADFNLSFISVDFNVSGKLSAQYRLDAGAWADLNYTDGSDYSALIYTDGTHTLDYNFSDNAGNANTGSVYAYLDKTAPSVGATTISGFSVYSSFIKGTGDIIGGSASDSISGINSSSCEFTDDNGSAWLAATWNSGTDRCEKTGYPVSDAATYVFNTRVENGAGLVGTGTATARYTGDLSAPTTTPSGYGTGWNNSAPTVLFSCSDANGSGCANTEYRIDLNSWVSSSSVSISSDGNHRIDYRSADNLSNQEAIKTIYVAVDLNAPATSISGCPAGWNTSSKTLSLSCSDSTSGCAATAYRIDNNSWLPYSAPFVLSSDGNHRIDYNSADNALNYESAATLFCAIDAASPSVGTSSIEGFATYGTGTVYIKGDGNILGGTASDSTSGINSASCEYYSDGSTWLAATWNPLMARCEKSSFSIANGTTYIFNSRVDDNAGNAGTGTATGHYVGDTLAPVTADNSDANSHGSDLNITLSPNDSGSGVNATYYCLQTSDEAACTPSDPGTSVEVTCAANNQCYYYIRYYSVDNLDNNEAVKTSSLITIDKNVPDLGQTVADMFLVYGNYAKGGGDTLHIKSGTITHADINTASCQYTYDGGLTWLPADWNAADSTCAKDANRAIFVDGASYVFNMKAYDLAGNLGIGTATISYTKDISPPSTYASGYSAGWSSAPQSVFFACSDTNSGCKATYYQDNGGPLIQGNTLEVSADGNHSITYYSVDNLDNNELAKVIYVAVDQNAPTAPGISLSGFAISGAYINGTGSIIGGATTDSASDINQASCEYSLDNGNTWAGASWNGDHCEKTSISVSNAASYQFKIRAMDNAGNIGASAAEGPYTGDTVAPSTSASGYGTGWNNSNQAVSLSCSDPASGCLSTKYRVDSGSWVAYSGPFTISADGNHRIDYNSTDSLGNAEAAKTIYVAVDKTDPSVGATSVSGFSSYGAYIKGTGRIIGGAASDSNSGIDTNTCEYTLDNGLAWGNADWNADANICQKSGISAGDGVIYNFSARVKDNAANQGSGGVTSPYIGDTAAPSTTDNSDTAWHGNDINVTLTPTDAGCGVAATYYCADTTNTCLPSVSGTNAQLTCAANSTCLQYVRYYSVDNLGNSEGIKSSSQTRIDKSLPSVGATSVSGFSTYLHYIKGTGKVVGGAVIDESGSGLDTPQYTTDNGATWLTGTLIISDTNRIESADLDISDNNSYTFNTRIRDTGSGQIAAGTATIIYTGDLSAPTTASSGPAGYATSWLTSDFNVALNCTDSVSGCKSTYYSADGAAWTTGTSVPITSDGNHEIRFYSIDNLDNNEAAQSSIKSTRALLDKSPPSVTLATSAITQTAATVSAAVSEYSSCSISSDNVIFADSKNGTSLSWDIASLAAGTAYTRYVKCTDAASNSTTQSADFTTLSAATSAAPDRTGGIAGGPMGGTGTGTGGKEEKGIVYERTDLFSSESMSSPEAMLGLAAVNSFAESALGKPLFSQEEMEKIKNNALCYGISRYMRLEPFGPGYRLRVEVSITNNCGKSYSEVRVIEAPIPKEFAPDASRISSEARFEVIISDPLIGFTLPLIGTGETKKIAYFIDLEKAIDLNRVNASGTDDAIPFSPPLIVSQFEQYGPPKGDESQPQYDTSIIMSRAPGADYLWLALASAAALLILTGYAAHRKGVLEKIFGPRKRNRL